MTLKEKLISEGFVGRLHRNKKRLCATPELSFDEFYELNKKEVHSIFREFADDKTIPQDINRNDILLAGLKSYFAIMPSAASIFDDSDEVKGFWPALIIAIVMAIVGTLLST